MGLKIAVSGKGGVGKSTIAAMFAHLASSEGCRVLAIDADPDANLAAALGMSRAERASIISLAQRRALIEARTGAKVRQYGQIFRLNPDVSDIVENESASFRGIHLLQLGAVESGGSGCACPENVLLRSLLTDVILYRDDLVIIDFEAGLEHLGRATGQGLDIMVIVVEPGHRSIETAESIRTMAMEIGIERFAIIGNKTTDRDDIAFLRESMPLNDYIGSLPLHADIKNADRDGIPLIDAIDETLLSRFHEIWERVKQAAAS